MFKIINTALLLLLVTACSAQEESHSKETNASAKLETSVEKTPTKTPNKASTVVSENNSSDVKKAVETPKKPSDSNATTSTLKTSIFTLKTLDGRELHVDETDGGMQIQEFKDKIVFLLFFGHRCPPCLAEMPDLIKLTAKQHPDMEILAVEVQGLAPDKLRAFKKEKGINYTLLSDKENYDFVSYVAKRAQWGGSIPFLVVFDKKGEVKVVHVGGMSGEEFSKIYTTLSAEK